MKAKGFTLIEVLIAMTLLSVVMYIGSLSFSIFSERWRKDLGQFNSHVNDAQNLLLLRQTILGSANYLVRDKDNRAAYLFYGDTQQLTFVTNKPIFQTGYQALVRLTIKTLENGQQQLLYSESTFKNQPVYQFSPLPKADKTLLLLQSDNIRFNYFGWQSFSAWVKNAESDEGVPSWQSSYQALEVGMIPFAVNLSWAQNEPIIFILSHDNRTNNANVYDERDEA